MLYGKRWKMPVAGPAPLAVRHLKSEVPSLMLFVWCAFVLLL